MATFTLTIETGNEAMSTVDDIARALRRVSMRLDDSGYRDAADMAGESRRILDDNGNGVGAWAFTAEEGR